MPTRLRSLLGTVAACAAALVLAAPAGAITFGPPVTVNGPDTRAFQSPALAVNAAGDVVVAWSDTPGGVYASFRPRGGSFSRPQLLSGRRVEGTDLSAAIGASGEALVAWAENETLAALGRARARVVVSVRAPGARRFGGRKDLSLGQAGADDPALGVTPSGEAVVVWEELRLNPRGVRTDPLRVSSAIRPPGGAWSAPHALSEEQQRFTSGVSAPARNPMVPLVSVLPSGAALAVWERASGLSTTCCQRVEAAVRPAGGTFGPAGTLTEAVDRGLAVARDAKGAGGRWGVLAWNEAALQLFERSESGDFTGPVAIPGTLDQFSDAALALAPDGAATVLKGVPLSPGAPCSEVPGAGALATTSRPAGGLFGPDHGLGPGDQPAFGPEAGVGGGRAIFSWDQPRRSSLGEQEPIDCDTVDVKPFGADGVPGADPGAPLRASTAAPDGSSPTLAVDPSGTAVLAWIGGNQRVRVARIGGGRLGRNRFPDIVEPRIRRVRLRPIRVAPGGRVRIAFRLSERATVTVRVFRRGRVARRVRVLRRAGARRVSFRAPARRATYSVELVARDRAGNRSLPGASRAFTVS